ncbi:MAG TPA: alpha/beta hydrolase [Gemmatimonadaceae bacterium]|nr:alpha/beta hydrolase [Gemmatimonadaceae bacterium]
MSHLRLTARRSAASLLLASLGTALPADSALAQANQKSGAPIETRIDVGGASLYARVVGRGNAIIVLHGGPDFDHAYLLPEFDQLSDSFRLIYYDQRGRGRSADGVRPEDVTLASDVEDIDRVRRYYTLDAPAVLGHSWGAVLALEYAIRHPTRVSRLILLNAAPASAADRALLRTAYLEKLGADMDKQRQIMATDAYKEGDPGANTARYRIHFKPALVRPEDYERLMARMQAAFYSQGKEGIVKARAVEDQLMRDTWDLPDFDLLPELRSLHVPTLVIASDRDFIPVEVSAHIAQAIPGAKLVILQNCGHFSYLECPAAVRRALNDFFAGAPSSPGRD